MEYVEVESDTTDDEAVETRKLSKKSRGSAPAEGHSNEESGTLGVASSSLTVDKVIVEEVLSSRGENDYLELDEELDEESHDIDAEEVHIDAFDQQSKRVFKAFEKWILSPDGGEKDPKPTALVLRQVEKVLSMTGTKTVQSLFEKKLIRDKFYPESRALHKAATTISYLHS